MDTFLSLIKAWKQKGITKTRKMLKKKFESSFTFVTFKLFLNQKKFAHFQIGPQMVHNIDSKKKTALVGIKWGFSGTHRTSYISKNPNLYPRQSRITLPTLL